MNDDDRAEMEALNRFVFPASPSPGVTANAPLPALPHQQQLQQQQQQQQPLRSAAAAPPDTMNSSRSAYPSGRSSVSASSAAMAYGGGAQMLAPAHSMGPGLPMVAASQSQYASAYGGSAGTFGGKARDEGGAFYYYGSQQQQQQQQLSSQQFAMSSAANAQHSQQLQQQQLQRRVSMASSKSSTTTSQRPNAGNAMRMVGPAVQLPAVRPVLQQQRMAGPNGGAAALRVTQPLGNGGVVNHHAMNDHGHAAHGRDGQRHGSQQLRQQHPLMASAMYGGGYAGPAASGTGGFETNRMPNPGGYNPGTADTSMLYNTNANGSFASNCGFPFAYSSFMGGAGGSYYGGGGAGRGSLYGRGSLSVAEAGAYPSMNPIPSFTGGPPAAAVGNHNETSYMQRGPLMMGGYSMHDLGANPPAAGPGYNQPATMQSGTTAAAAARASQGHLGSFYGNGDYSFHDYPPQQPQQQQLLQPLTSKVYSAGTAPSQEGRGKADVTAVPEARSQRHAADEKGYTADSYDDISKAVANTTDDANAAVDSKPFRGPEFPDVPYVTVANAAADGTNGLSQSTDGEAAQGTGTKRAGNAAPQHSDSPATDSTGSGGSSGSRSRSFDRRAQGALRYKSSEKYKQLPIAKRRCFEVPALSASTISAAVES